MAKHQPASLEFREHNRSLEFKEHRRRKMKFLQYAIAVILIIPFLIAFEIKEVILAIRNHREIRADIKAARKAEREKIKFEKRQEKIGGQLYEILAVGRAFSKHGGDWYLDNWSSCHEKTYLIKVLKVRNPGRYSERHDLFLSINVDLRQPTDKQVAISIPDYDPLRSDFYGYYSVEKATELLRLKLVPIIEGPARKAI